MADVAQQPGSSRTRSAKARASPESTDTGLKMDQDAVIPAKSDAKSETKSDSGCAMDGIVSNTQPVTEEEAEQMLAPEEFFAEEEHLRHERERQQAEAAKAAAEAAAREAAALDKQRFSQLDHLLTRAGMYTNFLMEQMQVYHHGKGEAPAAAADGAGTCAAAAAEEEEQEDEAAPAGKKGNKRRKSAAKAPASKKQRAAAIQDVAARGEAAAAAAAAGVAAATGTLAERQKKLLPLIKGELREYQLAGVAWLISLFQNGLNGILADQMGLGKTLQTISFISHLKAKGISGPFLIIAPLSTLRNWTAEVRRWCPSLPVLEYHGSGAKARAALRAEHMPLGAVSPDFPVVVSTYEIVMADIKALARYHWKYIVVDEGHRLKNFNCKLIRDLKMLQADNKLLLTGTPLQNNLGELWSLLNFLLPDIFASLADFQAWFDFDGVVGGRRESGVADADILAAEQRNNVVTKLHTLLKPFMLRRLKADVEISLPRKQEVLLYAPMSAEQQRLNTQMLEKKLAEEMGKLAEAEGTSSGGLARINNVLMQMRKNCNHPDLITSEFTRDLEYPSPDVLVAQSGKMGLVERLLRKLRPGGHKVLIFSQMTRMLDLLESYLSQSGHQPCRIDGSMPFEARQKSIESFNTDPNTWVFLLSTRAGGLGINLTAADTVIIYDSDWNPHQDLQAMDRCHRIGQDRPVLVFRLATAHSVEGKMLRRACDKMALERLVIKKGVFKEVLDTRGGGQSSKSLSAQELVSLLKSDISMDDVPQSGVVSDETLDQLLDRSWMIEADKQAQAAKEAAAAAAAAPAAAAQQQPAAQQAVEEEQQQPAAKGGSKRGGKRQSRGGGAAAGEAGAEAAAAAAAAADDGVGPSAGSGRDVQGGLPYPPTGVGYEVVQAMEESLLSNVNNM